MNIWKYITLFLIAVGIVAVIVAIITKQYYLIVSGLLIAGVNLLMYFKVKEKEHNAKKRAEQTNDGK